MEDYLEAVREAKRLEWLKYGYNMEFIPTFSTIQGKRFTKITCKTYGQTSVHCFVETATGDIYKAAGWSSPAKGVRGNINDEQKPLLGYDFYK